MDKCLKYNIGIENLLWRLVYRHCLKVVSEHIQNGCHGNFFQCVSQEVNSDVEREDVALVP